MRIKGYANDCGEKERTILLMEDGTFIIGCFSGDKEQAIEAISDKYKGGDAEDYIKKLEECERKQYKIDAGIFFNELDTDARMTVARQTRKYDDILYKDEDYWVRETVARHTREYDNILYKDKNAWVREAVARLTRKYDNILHKDKDWCVREAIARHTRKYDNILHKDEDERVRKIVARYTKKRMKNE